MYRVILVDDEPWEVRGLERVFKWKENGFEIAGRYTDPVIALDAICSTKCDLVITDIRMPEISGIELIRRVRKAGIDAEFVIISGFAEFSYAQEAIREGAFDYWLKPVMMDEADELLSRLLKKLEEKKNTADFKLIEQIMEEDGDVEAVLSDSAMNFGGRDCQTVLLELPQKHNDIAGDFREAFRKSQLELCWGSRKKLFIFGTDGSLLEDMKKWYCQCGHAEDITMGVSRTGSGVRNLRQLINESLTAAKNNFIYNGGGVYLYSDVNKAAVNEILGPVEEMLRHNDMEKVVQAIRSIPEQFVVKKLSIRDFFHFWSRISVALANSPLLYRRAMEYDVDDSDRIILEFRTLSAFCSYLSEFLLTACSAAEGDQLHKQDSKEVTEVALISSSMASIFRYAIKEDQIVSIKIELDCIKKYFTVMDIRYEGKFALAFEVDEGILEYQTLKMVLQPIVENAIYHGLETKRGKGRVLVKGYIVQEKTICFEVIDDGIGMNEMELAELERKLNTDAGSFEVIHDSRRSIGLFNINSRIKIQYGMEYGIQVYSTENQGTRVSITLPAIKP